jgi:hypothetical protein
MTPTRAVEWMSQRGITSYITQIQAIRSDMAITRAEAGRYGDQCEATQRTLSLMATEIAEIEQAAADRYEDWATD